MTAVCIAGGTIIFLGGYICGYVFSRYETWRDFKKARRRR